MLTEKTLKQKIMDKDKVILYHGSRGGISGEIEPISRPRCDFGKGFYMGTNPEQAKGLIIEDASPVFYTIELDFSKIPRDKILVLDREDWLHAVLAFREKSELFSSSDIAKNIIKKVNSYGIVIGGIADDRMNEAIREFTANSITDKGLLACLQSIDYGQQIVCKTDEACSALKIISQRDIYGKEADDIRKYTYQKREEARNIIQEMKIKYLRDGLYLNEIVAKAKEKTESEKQNIGNGIHHL